MLYCFFLNSPFYDRGERINGAIEELKWIGRGYRNKQNFRTAILFFHGDLNGFSHKTQ